MKNLSSFLIVSPLKVLFIIFVLMYALVLLINVQLGADIDGAFLRTLQIGKPLLAFSDDYPYSDQIALGRWTPMVNMEYNFIGLFSRSPNPFWYYFYHVIQFVLFVFLLIKLLSRTNFRKNLIYGAIIILILLPSSVLGWFRLSFPERNVLFFFVVFLLAYLSFAKSQKIWNFLLVLGAANLAIYYKEISFLAFGVFAIAHLIFLMKKGKPRKIEMALDGLIVLSSAVYLLLYYFIVYQNSSLTYLPHVFSLISRIKVFANYAFFSDSILVLILLPLTIWRLYKIFTKRAEIEPIWDAILLGASAYIGSFFILNLYGPYYLLPAYGLGLPAILYFFKDYSLKTLPLFFKIASGVTIFCLVFNAIPSGLYYLTYNKYYPVNFNKTADFLVEDINARAEKEPERKPSIFIYGVGTDSETFQGVYFLWYDFFDHKGLNTAKYDMKTDVQTTTDYASFSKIRPPFAVFEPHPAATPESGDYLLLVPSKSIISVDLKTIGNIKKGYDLIFETKSPLAFPNINLKTFVKYFLGKKINEGKMKNLITNKNDNFGILPNFYIFRKI